jgi:hypothetical protein
MSGTASVTFCFDKNYQPPGLYKVLSFLLKNHAEKLFCLDYYENGNKKEGYNIDLKLLNTNLPSDTKDFFMMYEWKKNEVSLITESAHEINYNFESDITDPFNVFLLSFSSGAYLEKHNSVFEEVEEFASKFIIYFYAETNTIIYDSENFEKNLRNNPKIQELISAFEKEFKTKVIKIGVSVSI